MTGSIVTLSHGVSLHGHLIGASAISARHENGIHDSELGLGGVNCRRHLALLRAWLKRGSRTIRRQFATRACRAASAAGAGLRICYLVPCCILFVPRHVRLLAFSMSSRVTGPGFLERQRRLEPLPWTGSSTRRRP